MFRSLLSHFFQYRQLLKRYQINIISNQKLFDTYKDSDTYSITLFNFYF